MAENDWTMTAETLHLDATPGDTEVITIDALPNAGLEVLNEGSAVAWGTKNTTVNPVADADGAWNVPVNQWIVVPLPRRRGNVVRLTGNGKLRLRLVDHE